MWKAGLAQGEVPSVRPGQAPRGAGAGSQVRAGPARREVRRVLLGVARREVRRPRRKCR